MNTSSLVADFKGHEDQRMIADSEINYTRADIFSGEPVIQRSINVLVVGVLLVGWEINSPFPSCCMPQFQSESSCTTIQIEMSYLFLCKSNSFPL